MTDIGAARVPTPLLDPAKDSITREGEYLFGSYSHRDAERVRPILDGLRDLGYRVWYDEYLDADSDWLEPIAIRVVNCAAMIAFISPAVNDSEPMMQELKLANNHRRPIVPVVLEETRLRPMAEMLLALVHHLPKFLYDDDEKFLKRLALALPDTTRDRERERSHRDSQESLACSATVCAKNALPTSRLDPISTALSASPPRRYPEEYQTAEEITAGKLGAPEVACRDLAIRARWSRFVSAPMSAIWRDDIWQGSLVASIFYGLCVLLPNDFLDVAAICGSMYYVMALLHISLIAMSNRATRSVLFCLTTWLVIAYDFGLICFHFGMFDAWFAQLAGLK